MRVTKNLEVSEKEDGNQYLVEVTAIDGEDLIEMKFESFWFDVTSVHFTTKEVIELINNIKSVIDECELEQFIEVNS